MQISKIKVGERFRKDLGDLETLKNSIKEIGLLQPIVVDEKNNLIAGFRRLRAFEELGKGDIPVNVINIENVLKGEYDENAVRKDFAPSEAVAIWGAMESRQGLRSETERSEKKIVKASKTLGISTDTLSKAKQVVDSGNQEVILEMDKTGNVNRAYNQIKAEERKIEVKNIPLPEGKYNVILCDAPWKYNDKQDSEMLGGAVKHYPTMSIDELCEMEIPSADNSIMFFWVTSPLLEECFKVINAWGFQYKTSFVWDKVKHNMGHYNSVRHEFLLVCVKGSKTPEVLKLFDSVITEERSDEHSKKPEIVYKIIETLYPNGKYLELFSRNKRNGWKMWGLEATK